MKVAHLEQAIERCSGAGGKETWERKRDELHEHGSCKLVSTLVSKMSSSETPRLAIQLRLVKAAELQ
jgi:hypothetical protein